MVRRAAARGGLHVALLLCLAACGSGQRVEFASARLGPAAEVRPTISGYLSKPDGQGPFPAVVLLHSCNGIAANHRTWAEWFRGRGYVALLVDSFTPRGVGNICSQLGQADITDRVADAFGGLDYLGTQPFVDRDRVLVMGFSNGGATTLFVAAPDPSISRPATNARFRGAVALYPECQRYVAPGQPPPSIPLLILVGSIDDWTPASACQRMAEINAGKGAPITLVVLPGARHGFDDPSVPFATLPTAMNINSPTGMGATVGSSARATAQSKEAIERFLARLMP